MKILFKTAVSLLEENNSFALKCVTSAVLYLLSKMCFLSHLKILWVSIKKGDYEPDAKNTFPDKNRIYPKL
jgi:hypothetical protein